MAYRKAPSRRGRTARSTGRRRTSSRPSRRSARSGFGGGTLKIVIEQVGQNQLARPAGSGSVIAPRKAKF